MAVSEAGIQARIDELPRDHKPRMYEVLLKDKKGHYLTTRYVRASSRQRAVLVGIKVQRFTFNDRHVADATAGLLGPVTW